MCVWMNQLARFSFITCGYQVTVGLQYWMVIEKSFIA